MTQISARHHKRLVVPQRGERLRHLRRINFTGHDRHELEIFQGFLEERHFNFAGVFPGFRRVRAGRRERV